MDPLRYPIGKANIPKTISRNDINNWIQIIEDHPKKMKALVKNLNKVQLDTPYRDDGWTIRQVVHHLGDSHLNSYIRFKWTLTENKPIIKAYFEDRWADLLDTKSGPLDLALDFLTVLHAKWVYLLKSLKEDDLSKRFVHPETNTEVSLAKNIGIYAWHCEHHYAHIANLLKIKNW